LPITDLLFSLLLLLVDLLADSLGLTVTLSLFEESPLGRFGHLNELLAIDFLLLLFQFFKSLLKP
jgi:hypothetical protein